MLVLASRSPQRRAILEQLGIEFRVEVADVEELAEGPPDLLVVQNAARKTAAVTAGKAESVLGADTAVALDGRVYGKPVSVDEAESFLRSLSGREHEVHGGLCLRDSDGTEQIAHAVTRVRFRALEPREIDWYLASEEWRERAGGYAIQGRGAALVERIEGDYLNVVGLPVAELLRLAPEILAP